MVKSRLIFGAALIWIGLLSQAHAWCPIEQNGGQQVAQDVDIAAESVQGKIAAVSIGADRYTVVRSQSGEILGIRSDRGSFVEIKKSSPASGKNKATGSQDNIDPCSSTGDSMTLTVENLPRVEVERSRAVDESFWEPVIYAGFPPLIEQVNSPSGSDKLKICTDRANRCIDRAFNEQPIVFSSCMKVGEDVKVKKPGWGPVIVAAIIAVCNKVGESLRDQKIAQCYADQATCMQQ